MNASVTHRPELSSPIAEEILAEPGGAASHRADAPPRRSEDFDTRTHNRHLRLAAVLDGCSEQPDFLFYLVGIEKIAETLSLPPAVIQRMTQARPSVRRRLAKRARMRLGLTAHHLEAARQLPDDPNEFKTAAHFFAVAIRVAGIHRVMPRAAFQALNDRYGVEAVTFGMSKQTLLGPHAEVLAEYQEEETPSGTDLRLFVRSLAAKGHAGAAIAALKLDLPVSLATTQVANIDLALETGLPDVALAALTSISERALEAVSADDEAAWQSDAVQDGSQENAQESEQADPEDDHAMQHGSHGSEPSSSPDKPEAA